LSARFRKDHTLPASIQNLRAIAAHWFVLSQLLYLLARQVVALNKMGAHEAVHKAELLDGMAKVALFDVAVRYQEALDLPKSSERAALLRQLDVTLFVLVGLRVLAWNIMLRRPICVGLSGAIISHSQTPEPSGRINEVDTIDSS